MIIKNLANILTLSRIVLTIVMAFLPTLSAKFMTIYSLAGVTDVLDGYVARKTNTVSTFGSKLDSVADLSFYTVMMCKIMPFLKKYLPDFVWIGINITLVIRVALYAYGLIKEKRLISNHTILNKTTGLLMFFLPFFIQTKYFVLYSGLVCTVALIAAIYEVYLTLILGRLKI